MVAGPRNRPPHSHAASEKLNSVVRVVQTGPPNRTGGGPRRPSNWKSFRPATVQNLHQRGGRRDEAGGGHALVPIVK